MKNKTGIKILITIKKKKKRLYRHLTPRRFTFFLQNKASSLLKNGSTIDITVMYLAMGKGFCNEKKDCSMQDLYWCKEAFVTDYL